MENGSKIDGPFFKTKPKLGQDLAFNYTITNLDDGHNLPSGSLGAQPEIWFNVALIDPDGKNIWNRATWIAMVTLLITIHWI